MMPLWSVETKQEFCCLVRGNKNTGTAVHILEESNPDVDVQWCIFEVFFGRKREETDEDVERRVNSVMPKGRGKAYREDCNSRPEIYRAGLERLKCCLFTVEHGAMKTPLAVLKGLSVMMDAIIRHQCDIMCGDGNQSTSTIISKQQEADFQNSMLVTAARAALASFNEGKPMFSRVGFEFFDNNPFDITEEPQETAALDPDCCLVGVFSWGHCASGHHKRCYARGVHNLMQSAQENQTYFDIEQHKGDVDPTSFPELGSLVEAEVHQDPLIGPVEFAVSRSERALHLNQESLCLRRFQNSSNMGDTS